MAVRIQYDRKSLEALCRKYAVRRLALFGSVVRSDFTPDSDVDVLVEFHSDRIPDLLQFGMLAEHLQSIFGRRVDLVTYNSLKNPFRRASILEDAEVQFDEAG